MKIDMLVRDVPVETDVEGISIRKLSGWRSELKAWDSLLPGKDPLRQQSVQSKL